MLLMSWSHACVKSHQRACDGVFGVGEHVISRRAHDISGMHTVLGHHDVMAGVLFVLDLLSDRPGGRSQVYHVASRGKARAGLGKRDMHGVMNVTRCEFVAACHIALAFAFGLFGSHFLLQVFGIPMGGPMSPFFAKCVTARACYHFYHSVYNEFGRRLYVFGNCFIDDINIFLVCDKAQYEVLTPVLLSLFAVFKSQVFPSSLVLEDDNATTYLETTFEVLQEDVLIGHNTKIDLGAFESDCKTVLRLHRYDSFVPKSLLYGLLVGTLSRCVCNTSHPHLMIEPVDLILKEFEWLEYPVGVLRAGLNRVSVRRRCDYLADVASSIGSDDA